MANPFCSILSMQMVLLALLRCYKFSLSPTLGHCCRFIPSCADYAHQAIQQYGSMQGSALAFKRVCRCHPFSDGGFDPVPRTRQFKSGHSF
jgi:uncharacterized protein